VGAVGAAASLTVAIEERCESGGGGGQEDASATALAGAGPQKAATAEEGSQSTMAAPVPQTPNSALARNKTNASIGVSSMSVSRRTSGIGTATMSTSSGAAVSANKKLEQRLSELNYPIVCCEPPLPELLLPEDQQKVWQQRIAQATPKADVHYHGSCAQLVVPPLDWYGSELQRTCGQALTLAGEQLVTLQAQHNRMPALLDAGSHLWPLLLEVSTTFGAAAYIATRVTDLLAREVPGGGGHTLAALRQLSGFRATRFGNGRSGEYPPPFKPRCASMAIAGLHMDIARLQATGTPLGAMLRLLEACSGANASTKVSDLRKSLLEATGKVDVSDTDRQQLYLLVPCLELAVERLGILNRLSDCWPGGLSQPGRPGLSSTSSEVGDEGEGSESGVVVVTGDGSVAEAAVAEAAGAEAAGAEAAAEVSAASEVETHVEVQLPETSTTAAGETGEITVAVALGGGEGDASGLKEAVSAETQGSGEAESAAVAAGGTKSTSVKSSKKKPKAKPAGRR